MRIGVTYMLEIYYFSIIKNLKINKNKTHKKNTPIKGNEQAVFTRNVNNC
jgi:hypothetical protein